MAEKKVNKARIIMKHDVEENWLKATNFIPLDGEIIIYDADDEHSYVRFKIGNGVSNVNELSFYGEELRSEIEPITNEEIDSIFSTAGLVLPLAEEVV